MTKVFLETREVVTAGAEDRVVMHTPGMAGQRGEAPSSTPLAALIVPMALVSMLTLEVEHS